MFAARSSPPAVESFSARAPSAVGPHGEARDGFMSERPRRGARPAAKNAVRGVVPHALQPRRDSEFPAALAEIERARGGALHAVEAVIAVRLAGLPAVVAL